MDKNDGKSKSRIMPTPIVEDCLIGVSRRHSVAYFRHLVRKFLVQLVLASNAGGGPIAKGDLIPLFVLNFTYTGANPSKELDYAPFS